MSDSLWPHGLQHARPCCPPSAPGVYSNSCPLSWWCHSTMSSSVIPFSSHLQSFPALGFFQMSQFFTSGGQSIRASVSASVLLMNIQDWFPSGWNLRSLVCFILYPNLISLNLLPLSALSHHSWEKFSAFKVPSDKIGSTHIIQDNLPTSRSIP